MYLLLLLSFSGGLKSIQVTPVDIVGKEAANAVVLGIKQIETDQRKIYLLCPLNERVLILDTDFELTGQIWTRAGQVEGPHEVSPTAIACNSESLAVLAHDRMSITVYRNGGAANKFNIGLWYLGLAGTVHDFVIDSNNRQVLIHTSPGFRYLAAVYNYEGIFQCYFGNTLKREEIQGSGNSALNDTVWARDQKNYYGLARYRPEIQIFEPSGKLLRKLALDLPKLETSLLKPLVFDFFVSEKFFYILDRDSTLHQFDKSGNKLLSIRFTHDQGASLPFTCFSVLNDSLILLGHPYLKWNHDLWLAKLR